MKTLHKCVYLFLLLFGYSVQAFPQDEPVRNVLFIGDSMTGWMAERLGAYGVENDFDVSTVLWDGSTIAKWAANGRVANLIAKYNPDAVFISLGMNELLESNPQKALGAPLESIKEQLGSTPYLWIGPPSWPGKGDGEALNEWLRDNLPENAFFCSSSLNPARQSKSNPHPTKDAVKIWMDEVADYVDSTKVINFKSINRPEGVQMKRGKVFVYKRMKETL